jgi:hypothetical protein
MEPTMAAPPANVCTDPAALSNARRRTLAFIAIKDADLRAVIREHARCAVLHPAFDNAADLRDFLTTEAADLYSINAAEASFFAGLVISEISAEVARLRTSLCSGGAA